MKNAAVAGRDHEDATAGGTSHWFVGIEEGDTQGGKYPPAKPGALELGPLKAARTDMRSQYSAFAPGASHLHTQLAISYRN